MSKRCTFSSCLKKNSLYLPIDTWNMISKYNITGYIDQGNKTLIPEGEYTQHKSARSAACDFVS